jgi:NAD(P)-dependent dehydrogenase (short-subunit alcohol dehydrogenase family)
MKAARVVVITGASAGVGRATARRFAREGAKIGLLARGEKGLLAAKKEVEELGGQAVVCVTDVSDPAQVERAADQVQATFGTIDVWVNNAMVSVFAPVREISPAEFKRVTEVTYLGYVHGTLSALKRMHGKGVIVQVGSALAYRSIPLQSAYCAAKHAIVGFTESLRCELLHDGSGIKVCNVHLPAHNTPQFSWSKSKLPREPQPVPPIFQPEVAAKAIVWMSHHPRRELWVAGPVTEAIVAEKIAPSLADHYLARNGYESQLTNVPTPPDRKDNLWFPVDRDMGAHGHFESAKSRSLQLDFWLAWKSFTEGPRHLAAQIFGKKKDPAERDAKAA